MSSKRSKKYVATIKTNDITLLKDIIRAPNLSEAAIIMIEKDKSVSNGLLDGTVKLTKDTTYIMNELKA
jgi:hypothetical protein